MQNFSSAVWPQPVPLMAGVQWGCVLSESQGVWLLGLLAGENLHSLLLHKFSYPVLTLLLCLSVCLSVSVCVHVCTCVWLCVCVG